MLSSTGVTTLARTRSFRKRELRDLTKLLMMGRSEMVMPNDSAPFVFDLAKIVAMWPTSGILSVLILSPHV